MSGRVAGSVVATLALCAGGAAGCGGGPRSPGPAATPIVSIVGGWGPDDGWPTLQLEPHVRCDGGAVLVPLEQVYGGERVPVSAAILDRRGAVITTLDLDAITDGFDGRDPAAVRRKVAAANAALAGQCWRPLALADEGEAATWAPPTLTLARPAGVVAVRRDDLVRVPIPDDDCALTEQVDAIWSDPGAALALVRIARVAHDNCGSTPPAWVAAPLDGPPAAPFVCELSTPADFEHALARVRAGDEHVDHAIGTCFARRDGERLVVRAGAAIIYTDKDGGAAWAYDARFVVDGVRPGGDAGLAAADARRRGATRLRCAGIGDDGEVDECSFQAPAAAPCGDGTYILLDHDPAAPPADTAEALRGRRIVAVALTMPC
ncbi:MAG: hypothetical protein JNK64_04665 [Myxococcales bacterium]|nr:hypothetical protein [Myxococcales bacterium]